VNDTCPEINKMVAESGALRSLKGCTPASCPMRVAGIRRVERLTYRDSAIQPGDVKVQSATPAFTLSSELHVRRCGRTAGVSPPPARSVSVGAGKLRVTRRRGI